MKKINIIGGGLAGSEAAYFLASQGIKVNLYDQKPKLGPAFHSTNFGELVCSNSLKSTKRDNACGLLKEEIAKMGSLIMKAAEISRVPSGQDLAVDRDVFSNYITEKIKENENITVISKVVESLDENDINIVCTGPLTDSSLCDYFKEKLGEDTLSFYDAAAPLVELDSLDTSKMYVKSRYDKGSGKYLNIPLNQEQYLDFVEKLTSAERVILHDFEHFEGCLPVEVMAKRGMNTLRFGPLKARGLSTDDIHPYAVVQLRQDNIAGTLYGMVGFQTNLKYKEQKRVFSSLPGMENAKFARYGLMHSNRYICAPKLINRDLSLKKMTDTFIAGQFVGVEGYVESAASGLLAAYYVLQRLKGQKFEPIPIYTMLGSLINYLVMSSPKNFAPINSIYGILQLPKKEDKITIYQNSMEAIDHWREKILLKPLP
ncbi:MAG: methylenetetrahydrofolate--tRNA-(uracil(54)-C(5))-methyltransferase (FADH(2)-oxidizing) TrmFO [Bacilli bacterium]